MFKFKRFIKYTPLTATITPQTYTPTDNSIDTLIRVITGDAIRISVNGEPASLSGTNGIFVDKNSPIVLENFVVTEIKYIRDNSATSDVNLDVIGLRDKE